MNREERESTIETSMQSLVRIGRLWAVYGLEIGRAALRTSSETLQATSEVLGAIARSLDPKQEPPPNSEGGSEPQQAA